MTPKSARLLVAADPAFATVVARSGPPRIEIPARVQPFAALARAIVYQQLNGTAAGTIWRRVQGLFPRRRRLHPDDVLAASDEALRGAGLSRGKLAALRDLAAKTRDGHLPTAAAMAGMDDDALIERLTEIRGIGRWTVEMLLIFHLGRPDVLPATDYGVRAGFAALHGQDDLPHPKDLSRHGERWRPHRSTAAWYLWRALEFARADARQA